MVSVVLIDGYTDEPAALGVRPYISPMARATAGAARACGATVTYLTIDDLRGGEEVPRADVSVLLGGMAVPGKYLRSMPASGREIADIAEAMPGVRVLGGAAARDVTEGFDHLAFNDLAASVHDIIAKRERTQRWRTLEEWNDWMLRGADIVQRHPDFPHPLIVEVETYRGCHRYRSGGCSYCIEPLKGRPLTREPEDIIAEVRELVQIGVRNVRLGGQTCIVSYKAHEDDVPTPDPEAVGRLFSGLSSLGLEVLHVDNANPAVIAEHPEEARAVLRTLVEHCTSGNVLALGMESADPRVIEENNLNSTPAQVMAAIRMINEVGGERGANGLPKLLPGLNLIAGLDGETAATYDLDLQFLKEVLDAGLALRRINIRQVMPVRREFTTKVSHSRFIRFKQRVREEVDHVMLRRMLPEGTVLRDVLTELHDGNTTFGRQVGTYPLLIGIPYRVELERRMDVKVIGWGHRSITAVEYPLDVNHASLSALVSLPGVGRKRAARIVRERPFRDLGSLAKALDDDRVAEALSEYMSF